MGTLEDRVKETLEDKGPALRKLGIPVTAGAIAAGAGLILTRKKSGHSLPGINDLGVGDLADDLRRKLDSVLNRTDQPKDQPKGERRSASPASRHVDLDELAQRRREREQRRSQRRRKN
jgi:hypothetical protein